MDLSTTYLGLRLPHPLMPGASPLADSLDTVKRLEDAGAAAIVLRSLFEEQITRERDGLVYHMEVNADVVGRGARPTSRSRTTSSSARTSTSSRSARSRRR